MSKFKGLCKAYSDYRDELAETRADAYDVAYKVVLYYLNYLNIDDENAYELVPLQGKVKEGSKYTPAGATHLGEDGYWHLGMHLTIYKDVNVYPQQTFVISFKFIKNQDGTHTLGIDGENTYSTVISDMHNDSEYLPVFDGIQQEILNWLADNKNFLKGKHRKMPTIGFIQEGIVSVINGEENPES